MTSEKLVEGIKGGESLTVEFKASFDKEVLETSVSFANTKGGTILIGVSDNGDIKGVQIGKETLKDWANQISQSTEPRIIPEIEIEETDRKKIAIIGIKEFPIKPVSIKGRCFRRVKNSNRVMQPHEIAEMHFQSTGREYREMFNIKNRMALIDLSGLCDKRILTRVGKTGRATEYILIGKTRNKHAINTQ